MQKRSFVTMFAIMFLGAFSVHAQTLVDFDFTVLPSKTMIPLSATDVLAEGVLIGDGLTPGGTVGTSNSNNAVGQYNWLGYNTTGGPGSGWLALTLTADTGSLLDLGSVTISLWRNGAGAPEDMRFLASVDGGPLEQVGDIITETISGDFSFRDYTFNLTSLEQSSSVELRFSPLPGGAGSEGVGNVHVNDLVVEGGTVVNGAPTVSNLAPDDDATGLTLQPELSWSSINAAAPTYEVNIGTDTSCSDILANYDVGLAVSYAIAADTLDYETIYYWRIDLWEDGTEYPGPVWSFRTESEPGDYWVIDNFDEYINTAGLTTVWQDGSVNGSGAVIAEAFTGMMKLDYSNQLSEVTRSFSSAQDWTANSMAMLALALKGDPGNQIQPLTVVLSDGTYQAAVDYIDSSILTKSTWTKIYFRLSDFSSQGVDLSNVVSISIQVGDGQSSATGVLYIDDLMLYTLRCVPEYRSIADRNGDCVVDLSDMEAFVQHWLEGDLLIPAQAPDTGALRAHYQFDDAGTVAADSSANSWDASVASAVWQGSGYDGGCLEIATDTKVTIPAAVFSSVSQEMTVSFWVKSFEDALNGINDQILAMGGAVPITDFEFDLQRWDIDNPEANHDQWHHCAVVKDASNSYAAIYWDGILVSEYDNLGLSLEGAGAGETVLSSNAVYTFDDTACWIDELQIYDAALSHSEVVYLYGGAAAEVTQPIYPLASQYDYSGNGEINLADFAILSSDWLAD